MVHYLIEKNILFCEKMWKKLSDNLSITDVWDYKMCFFRGYVLEPYFICAFEDDSCSELIAFLPLEYYQNDDSYMMFGAGDWNEYARPYISEKYLLYEKLPEIMSSIFNMIPPNSDLRYFNKSSLKYFKNLEEYKVTYSINNSYLDKIIHNNLIASLSTDSLSCFGADLDFEFNIILDRMSKDGRKHLKKELGIINSMNPVIKFNDFSSIDEMISFNKTRFKEDSSFSDPGFERAIRELVVSDSIRKYLRVVNIYINEKLVAIHLCSIYNGTYTALQGGNDISIPNLSKYLLYHVILDAIKIGAEKISLMSDDCGWKSHWRLDTEMLYHFKKKI